MTFPEFIATRQAVPCVRTVLLAGGYDYGDPPNRPGFIYDRDVVIYGTAEDMCETVWCCDVFSGTLAECESWLFQQLEAEGLV